MPYTLSDLSLSPATVTARQSSALKVVLDAPAPAGGISVSLKSSLSTASVPATVVVLAGSTSTTVTVTTKVVKTQKSVVIKATLNGSSKSVTLAITP